MTNMYKQEIINFFESDKDFIKKNLDILSIIMDNNSTAYTCLLFLDFYRESTHEIEKKYNIKLKYTKKQLKEVDELIGVKFGQFFDKNKNLLLNKM